MISSFKRLTAFSCLPLHRGSGLKFDHAAKHLEAKSLPLHRGSGLKFGRNNYTTQINGVSPST